jgi:SAM-dependent methyltransferase
LSAGGAPPHQRCFAIAALGSAVDAGATAHYEDPAYYDKTYGGRRADVEYYTRLASRGCSSILEYGIGTGRIALALARGGMEVTGIDRSRPMLRALEARLAREPEKVRRRVTARRGDMRSLRLGRRFPLVIAPFNVILHLYTLADVERFLARVREHLTSDGRFIFDFSVPHANELDRDPRRYFGGPRVRHPSTGKLVRYAERFEYDPLRQVQLIELVFSPLDGEPPISVPLTHRQFFPQELLALLHYNGFHRIRCTADFTDEQPGPHVDSMVVECRARTRARQRPRRVSKRVLAGGRSNA